MKKKKLQLPDPKKNVQYTFIKNWEDQQCRWQYKKSVVKVAAYKSLPQWQKDSFDQRMFDSRYFILRRLPARTKIMTIVPKLATAEKKTFWKSVICEKHFVKKS